MGARKMLQRVITSAQQVAFSRFSHIKCKCNGTTSPYKDPTKPEEEKEHSTAFLAILQTAWKNFALDYISRSPQK